MAEFGLVENGTLQKVYDVLPTNWKNISNISALSDEELKALGWYRILKIDPIYDTTTHIRGEIKHYFHENIVYETYNIVEKKVELLAPESSIELSIAEQYERIRAYRDHLMKDFEWRYNRYYRQVRLSITPTDTLESLDLYMHQLAEITNVNSIDEIVWPIFNG